MITDPPEPARAGGTPAPSAPGDRVPGSSAPGSRTAGGTPPPVDRRARRDRREGPDRRKVQVPVAVERRSSEGDRRRESDRRADGKRGGGYDLDPATVEFIVAINQFKEQERKPFPSWSEVLQILRDLGYEKRS